MCPDCVKIKDKPMTYTRCKECGDWRKMNPAEMEKAKKPWRFDGSGQATKRY
jgi:hypothetical protein